MLSRLHSSSQLHGHQIGPLAKEHAVLPRPAALTSQPPQPACRLSQRQQRADRLAASASLASQPSAVREPRSDIDWDSLGFGLQNVGTQMFVAETDEDRQWSGSMRPYGPVEMYPSAQVLNYGQSVFEGMKAQRSASGRIVLFRPDANAARMAEGAARMSMLPPPEEFFIDAVARTVEANQELVPPQGKGSLYMRPLLLGSGPILGLGPAPAYQFFVYCAAVGSYFKGGQLTPIDLLVESKFHRAAPGGMGGTKCAGNYSPVLLVQLAAKKAGYADVLYLDARSDTYLEEVSSCNVFIAKGRTIKTPPLSGTILPGVTRRSLLELAADRGYTVEEAPVTIHEALEADEVFTSGTAVVVSPVGSLTYKGEKRQYGEAGQPGPIALELYTALTDIQQEKAADKHGWIYPVC